MAGFHEMVGDMKVVELIEGIKRGEPSDEHWRRAIALSENIGSDFQSVLDDTLGALRYAQHPDTISALSTCLIEHLLEYDFSAFDRLEEAIESGDDKMLYALSLCAKFGASQDEMNSRRWDALLDKFSQRKRAYSQMLDDKYPEAT
jgi:hypothetical protein